MKITKTLYVTNREEWRTWLENNHASEAEVWLVVYKKHTGQPSIPYDDAVDEALCFGWIDSLVQRIDDDTYAQKFTPRKSGSRWSESNRQRVSKLTREGRMTPAGLAKLDGTTVGVNGPEGFRPELRRDDPVLPAEMEEELMANEKAWACFSRLPPSHRRNYIRWITTAKKEETRQRRLRQAIGLLEQDQRLGPK